MKSSIEISGIKSFVKPTKIFEDIKQLNIIIGKNNSGKSTVLDIVDYLTTLNYSNGGLMSSYPNFNIKIGQKIHPDYIKEYRVSKEMKEVLLDSLDEITVYYNINSKNSKENVKAQYDNKEINIKTNVLNHFESIIHQVSTPLIGNTFVNIKSERDISSEKFEKSINNKKFHRNLCKGSGITNLINNFVNMDKYESSIIEETLMKELNFILNPEINYKRILLQYDIDSDIWEINFEDKFNNRIPISKMGSGIKTILMVLVSILIIPYVFKQIYKENNIYTFAFEELENNLHPAVLKRLFRYIVDYSKEHTNYNFFITTHSNIVVDIFSKLENSQIIHTEYFEGQSHCRTVIKENDYHQIFKDLDFKASDILLTNGIIWVEGPSDRNYILKWLELKNSNLIEGLHFSIMYYGGKILSHYSFDKSNYEENEVETLIKLLRINRNAYVVMDKDAKKITQKLSKTKQRVIEEIGESKYWLTEGREIENYLHKKDLNLWLNDKYISKREYNFEIDKFGKIEDQISKTGCKIKYSSNKNKYSKEISEYFTVDSLKVYDLDEKISEIIKAIDDWN